MTLEQTMDVMREAMKAAGIPCYPPDVKPGLCKAPYAVIYDGGTLPTLNARGLLGKYVIRVVVLAPQAQDKALTAATRTVCAALSSIQGVRSNGEITAIDNDPERAALYQSMDYTKQYAKIGG